jgi:CDGSH-type Zn-finger protein
MDSTDSPIQKISIRPNGPYRVEGGVPLVRKTQVVSEYGEPLTWKKDGAVETEDPYFLCRCGHSSAKPFCDSSHRRIAFDGTETADPRPSAERQEVYPGATGIDVRHDDALCMESGFCGTRLAAIARLVSQTDEPQVRAQVMAMIERCPSGSLVYALAPGEPDIEPDLPRQIALTTDVTSDGPVAGAYWVTGGIPVERSDGSPLETRSRVTLCSCGRSANKPLCDGAHRRAEAEATE